MNIQTEKTDNHAARVTVQIEPSRLEGAKQKAAQQLSRRVNIPGFRKGKVPYRILVNYVGEQAIMEEAVEMLSNDIYKEMLVEANLDPYGPGEVEGFEMEPAPTYKFIVPLQPEVELLSYRDVRVEFAPPTVTDKQVDEAMRELQEAQALVEPSSRPVEMGNRATFDLHSYILDDSTPSEAVATDPAPEAGTEGEASAVNLTDDTSADADAGEPTPSDADPENAPEEHDHAHHHGEGLGEPFMHEHDEQFIVDAQYEPVPGFAAALIGANIGETQEFDLEIPADFGAEDGGEANAYAGKRAHFAVTVKKIENVTLPALTDDFAARVTAEDEKPLTLLELRMRTREELVEAAEHDYRNEYANRALDQMIAGAQIGYPELMVREQTDSFLQYLDQNLRRQGITLEDYMKIYRKSMDDMRAQYREMAEQALKRQLVLQALLYTEQIRVPGENVEARIDQMIGSVADEQREGMRQLFDQNNMRSSLINDMLQETVMDRILAIAKGEAPELPPMESTDTDPGTTAEPAAPAESEAAPEGTMAETPAEVGEAIPDAQEQIAASGGDQSS